MTDEEMKSELKRDEERIETLEDKVDELDEALGGLAEGVLNLSDILETVKFFLYGYSEGESTYPEAE